MICSLLAVKVCKPLCLNLQVFGSQEAGRRCSSLAAVVGGLGHHAPGGSVAAARIAQCAVHWKVGVCKDGPPPGLPICRLSSGYGSATFPRLRSRDPNACWFSFQCMMILWEVHLTSGCVVNEMCCVVNEVYYVQRSKLQVRV